MHIISSYVKKKISFFFLGNSTHIIYMLTDFLLPKHCAERKRRTEGIQGMF